MTSPSVLHLFKTPFLSQFVLAEDTLPFKSEEIILLDRELNQYEQLFLNPNVEQSLISKNELLASFAISKAEHSSLTLAEASEVYKLLTENPDYDFIAQKLKAKRTLTHKDHDKLEFFNIAKTFRFINQQSFNWNQLTPKFIKHLHARLTQGLDIFQAYLTDFSIYKSGQWRDNDTIRVGSYIPAPYLEIHKGVAQLISYIQSNQTITGTAVFHTALYALHPFNNGNKRVCRILEHLLLRGLGLNSKNLYSPSYYYHKEKPRYYKYLLYSLERKNLNHFVSFALEAVVLSIISVVKTSLEAKRTEYLSRQDLEATVKSILRPLIKRREAQFKSLFKKAKGKMARQTFVTYLNRTVEEGVVLKRGEGRSTYYRLNLSSPEEATLKKWIQFAKKRLAYIPTEILLA